MAGPRPTAEAQSGPPRPRDTAWVIGKLLRHGEDHYAFDSDNPKSYYVQLLTRESEQGARNRREYESRSSLPIDGREETLPVNRDSGGKRTLWGWDLKRAIRESQSKPQVGDEVALRVVRTEPVYDGKGQARPGKFKNVYEVERLSFVNVRHTNARKILEDYREGLQIPANDPEGRQLYVLARAVEKLAELRYRNPDDRKRFTDGVMRAVEQSPDREALIAAAARRAQDRKPGGVRPESTKAPNPDERAPLTRD